MTAPTRPDLPSSEGADDPLHTQGAVSAWPVALTGQTLRFLGDGAAHATWAVLSGGRANRVWRVRRPSGDAIVKLYDMRAKSRLFPNHPKAEARILGALSGTGLGPDLLGLTRTRDGPVLVYRAVEGTTLADTVSPDALAALAATLARLHRRAPVPGYRRVGVDPLALWRGIAADLAGLPDDPLTLRIARAAMQTVRPAPPVAAPSLLHGDPVPGNVVIGADGGITLIDWQCPALGDPVHDLALALSPGMRRLYGRAPLSSDEIERFWQAYGDPAAKARHAALMPLLSARIAAHCIAQAARGRDGYAEAARAEVAAMPDLEQ